MRLHCTSGVSVGFAGDFCQRHFAILRIDKVTLARKTSRPERTWNRYAIQNQRDILRKLQASCFFEMLDRGPNESVRDAQESWRLIKSLGSHLFEQIEMLYFLRVLANTGLILPRIFCHVKRIFHFEAH